MYEIRFHGRGGQGAVIASNLLAEAFFIEGYDVQAFPYFGVERRGAPVTAFTRADKKPIRVKTQIYEPDYVVVLDPSVMAKSDVTAGLKPHGLVLINTPKKPEEFKDKIKAKVYTVDASAIAMKYKLGSRAAPIVNTAILGGFAHAAKMPKIDSIIEAIKKGVPTKVEENANAAKEAYNATAGD
jgi:2-oxoacid:acceptor oxidoreductase gamma subunit (pyruvate/2-ketoisovalerate family)